MIALPLALNEPVRALGDHLWQSTVCVGAIYILALALRRYHARLHVWLWCAASLKFLIPLWLLMAAGATLASVPAADVTGYASTPFVIASIVSQPLSAMPASSLDSTAAVPIAVASAPAPSTPGLTTMLLCVWALGAFALAVHRCRQVRRLTRLARSAVQPADGRESDALARVRLSSDISTTVRFALTDATMEPAVFGLFRPTLLWPRQLTAQLTDGQIDALLLHELCHAHQRDNLMSASHMLVEVVFWFHPLVWWVGARLLDARERACDEEVVRRGGVNVSYAEGILKTCQFCAESPLTCVSGITGSDLKQRIEAIMRNRMSMRLTTARKMALASIVALGIVAPVAIGAETARLQHALGSISIPRLTDVSVAHLPAAVMMKTPVLEGGSDAAPSAGNSREDVPPATVGGAVETALVADDAQVVPQPAGVVSATGGATLSLSKLTSSVQRQWFSVFPSRWNSTSSTPQTVGHTLVAQGLTLRNLVGYAYGTEKGAYTRWQVLGGPDWIDTTRFDVTLPIPPGDGEPLIVDSVYSNRGGRALPLLRQLLADRLGLQVRQEQQHVAVSNLVKIGDGPSIKPSKATCQGSDPANNCDFRGGPGFIAAQGQTIHFFVTQINWNMPGTTRMVLDKTGMTGRYDFAFGWNPRVIFAPNRADGFAENTSSDASTGWNQAIEAQLGLQYQSANELVDVIVIESAHPLVDN